MDFSWNRSGLDVEVKSLVNTSQVGRLEVGLDLTGVEHRIPNLHDVAFAFDAIELIVSISIGFGVMTIGNDE